jgi:hypothetical protein
VYEDSINTYKNTLFPFLKFGSEYDDNTSFDSPLQNFEIINSFKNFIDNLYIGSKEELITLLSF